MGSFSIWHWLVVAVVIAVIVFGIRYIHRRNNRLLPNGEPSGIAGWLILPALGLVAGGFVFIYLVFSIFIEYESYRSIIALWNIYPSWVQMFFIGALVQVIVFFVMTFISGYFFFTKNIRAPAWIISLMAISVVFSIWDYWHSNQSDAVAEFMTVAESRRELMRSIGAALIWIPYFLLSKRVKNTFVNGGNAAISPNEPASAEAHS